MTTLFTHPHSSPQGQALQVNIKVAPKLGTHLGQGTFPDQGSPLSNKLTAIIVEKSLILLTRAGTRIRCGAIPAREKDINVSPALCKKTIITMLPEHFITARKEAKKAWPEQPWNLKIHPTMCL